MSLLLDALKKAAEKNADKEKTNSKELDSTQIEKTTVIDETVVVDASENDLNNSDGTEAYGEEPEENLTELELAQIINEQKEKDIQSEGKKSEVESLKELEDDALLESALSNDNDVTDIKSTAAALAELDNSDEFIDSDPSLALIPEDDDPSLKLALSDEEILLTDDDVTEFLGGDELQSQLEDPSFIDNSEFSAEETTGLSLADKTTTESLNLVEPPLSYDGDSDDATITGYTSTTRRANQTTNLNSLTNDATSLNLQDRTSTQTFASDNYDRTLVKVEDDVSKVFTGLKSDKSGAAMTPDFAKKVFVRKSTTLRRQNYKIYGLVAFLILVSIAVFSVFEMQDQLDEIDSSLARLNRNPVPLELRQKREKKDDAELAVLEGRVDTEALKLLKSLNSQNNDSQQANNVDNTVVQSADESESLSSNTEKTTTDDPNLISKGEVVNEDSIGVDEAETVESKSVESQTVTKPIADQTNTAISKAKKEGAKKDSSTRKKKKSPINIETKLVASKESVWLKEAYTAFENGNLELAFKNYKRVLDKNPKNRDALLGQAAIYANNNDSDRAINNYQKLLLENPKDILAMTSLIAASNMSPVESESQLKLLQRETPNAAYLQFALGNVIAAQNRWKEAQNYYYQAHISEPTNPDFAYNLAVSLEQINKPEIAINYYKKAIENAESTSAAFDIALIQQRIEVLSQ